MAYVNVKNGTNAGWRRVKEAPKVWTCPCPTPPGYVVVNARYLTQCKSCGERRPD